MTLSFKAIGNWLFVNPVKLSGPACVTLPIPFCTRFETSHRDFQQSLVQQCSYLTVRLSAGNMPNANKFKYPI
jgi:hypothetical protein